jgi:PAS domain S-box-containing protein
MSSAPRWGIPVFTMAGVALLASGTWFYADQKRHLRRDAETRIQAIAQLKTRQIAEWRAERLVDARILADNPALAGAAAALAAKPHAAFMEPLTQLRAIWRRGSYADAMLVDSAGRVLYSAAGHGALDGAALQTLSAALAANQVLLTPLYLSAGAGPRLDALAPLYAADARPVGAVALEIDSRQVLFPMVQAWPVPSPSAESVLVQRDGGDALFLNDLRHRSGTAMRLRIPLARRDVPAVMAVLGKQGIVEGLDYRGVEVLSALAPVPGSDWLMVAKVDAAEELSAWRYRGALIISLIGALLGALAFSLWAVWQVQSRASLEKLLRAEAARKRSEERHGATLMSVGDGVIATDAESRVTLLNPVAEDLTGWTQAEAAGRSLAEVFQIVNEDTGEPVENPVARVLREGAVVGLANHTILVSKSGVRRPIADSGAPIRSAEGLVDGVILVFRDVTESARYEREREGTLELLRLFNREDQTHELIRAVTALLQRWTGCEAIGIRLRDGGDFPYYETCGFSPDFVQAESRLCALTAAGDPVLDDAGYPILECACGNVLSGRFDPSLPFYTPKGSFWTNSTSELVASGFDMERPGGAHNRCIGDGYESVALFRLQTSGRAIGLLQVNDRKKGRFTPELLGFLENVADQSAIALSQRQTQAELRQREAHLRDANGLLSAILENTNTAVAYLDRDFNFIWVNHAYSASARNEPAFFVGKSIFDLFPSEKLEAEFKRVVATGDPYFAYSELFRFPGQPEREITYWDWSLIPVKTEGGEVRSLVLTLTETTQHVKATEEKERLQAQLLQAQKMESVGRLAGGIAHDFNNLLTVISGYSAMTLNQITPGDPLRDSIEEVLKASDRAAELVRQLLAFSRKHALHPETFDLNETVAGMANMLARMVGEDVRVTTRLDPSLSPVLADRRHFGQVIINLAVNARDAMPSGGELTIETSSALIDGPCRRCAANVPAGRYVQLTVRDTGAGMDPRTMRLMFEPFFTTKEVGKGTGLGLATVHGIVTQSGGHIDVESEVGRGSAFHILLPAVETPAPVKEPADAKAVARGAETILLVEDQREVRNFTTAVLRSFGYKVVAAPDAETALRMVEEEPAQLLLTDVVMPGIDGPHLAERIRASHPNVRTLFMSGYSDDRLASDGALPANQHFIQKPFSPAALAEKIRRILDAPLAAAGGMAAPMGK